MCKIKLVSSLIKVFPDKEPDSDLDSIRLSAFQNEVLCFQLAYYGEGECTREIYINIESELNNWITIRKVITMPSRYPCSMEIDDNYLNTNPGLYPDLLRECIEGKIQIIPGQWGSVLVELNGQHMPDGTYSIDISFTEKDNTILEEVTVPVCIYRGNLKEQTIKHTEWFYADCLADYYHVIPWSKEHFRIVEEFIKTYAAHGMNMILTPIINPSLDVLEGGSRTNVQLVTIHVKNGKYEFQFDKLNQWITICKKYGITYFEMAHLYTQWGAKYAPEIYAIVDGKEKKIFGWNTLASDIEYQTFLSLFLPELVQFLKEQGLNGHVYFHVSDEPSIENIEAYIQAKKQISNYIDEFPIIDALSSYQFYELGVLDHPIPSIDHIEPFLKNGVQSLWAYYCSAQKREVSNRFFAMPLARTRILGVQLYRYHIEGFLHWGFNFYNSQYSIKHINPYEVTDADNCFPSGDSFLVYPGKEKKPEESIRLIAMMEAMQDIRALQTLETYTSREHVEDIIQAGLDKPLTFSCYPTESSYILKLRQQVNKEIEQYREQ